MDQDSRSVRLRARAGRGDRGFFKAKKPVLLCLAICEEMKVKIVDSFAATPDQWWDAVGKAAYDRWNSWLKKSRDKLVWDPEIKVFAEIK